MQQAIIQSNYEAAPTGMQAGSERQPAAEYDDDLVEQDVDMVDAGQPVPASAPSPSQPGELFQIGPVPLSRPMTREMQDNAESLLRNEKFLGRKDAIEKYMVRDDDVNESVTKWASENGVATFLKLQRGDLRAAIQHLISLLELLEDANWPAARSDLTAGTLLLAQARLVLDHLPLWAQSLWHIVAYMPGEGYSPFALDAALADRPGRQTWDLIRELTFDSDGINADGLKEWDDGWPDEDSEPPGVWGLVQLAMVRWRRRAASSVNPEDMDDDYDDDLVYTEAEKWAIEWYDWNTWPGVSPALGLPPGDGRTQHEIRMQDPASAPVRQRSLQVYQEQQTKEAVRQAAKAIVATWKAASIHDKSKGGRTGLPWAIMDNRVYLHASGAGSANAENVILWQTGISRDHQPTDPRFVDVSTLPTETFGKPTPEEYKKLGGQVSSKWRGKTDVWGDPGYRPFETELWDVVVPRNDLARLLSSLMRTALNEEGGTSSVADVDAIAEDLAVVDKEGVERLLAFVGVFRDEYLVPRGEHDDGRRRSAFFSPYRELKGTDIPLRRKHWAAKTKNNGFLNPAKTKTHLTDDAAGLGMPGSARLPAFKRRESDGAIMTNPETGDELYAKADFGGPLIERITRSTISWYNISNNPRYAIDRREAPTDASKQKFNDGGCVLSGYERHAPVGLICGLLEHLYTLLRRINKAGKKLREALGCRQFHPWVQDQAQQVDRTHPGLNSNNNKSEQVLWSAQKIEKMDGWPEDSALPVRALRRGDPYQLMATGTCQVNIDGTITVPGPSDPSGEGTAGPSDPPQPWTTDEDGVRNISDVLETYRAAVQDLIDFFDDDMDDWMDREQKYRTMRGAMLQTMRNVLATPDSYTPALRTDRGPSLPLDRSALVADGYSSDGFVPVGDGFREVIYATPNRRWDSHRPAVTDGKHSMENERLDPKTQLPVGIPPRPTLPPGGGADMISKLVTARTLWDKKYFLHDGRSERERHIELMRKVELAYTIELVLLDSNEHNLSINDAARRTLPFATTEETTQAEELAKASIGSGPRQVEWTRDDALADTSDLIGKSKEDLVEIALELVSGGKARENWATSIEGLAHLAKRERHLAKFEDTWRNRDTRLREWQYYSTDKPDVPWSTAQRQRFSTQASMVGQSFRAPQVIGAQSTTATLRTMKINAATLALCENQDSKKQLTNTINVAVSALCAKVSQQARLKAYHHVEYVR